MFIPNGTTQYLETYFEVVSHIAMTADKEGYIAFEAHEEGGRGRLYELAEELTDEFERKYHDRVWDGDFFDTIDQFLHDKNTRPQTTEDSVG